MSGGAIGNGARLQGEIDISGGQIGSRLEIGPDSLVNVRGGNLPMTRLSPRTNFVLTGGEIGGLASAFLAEIQIQGGKISGQTNASGAARLDITSGILDEVTVRFTTEFRLAGGAIGTMDNSSGSFRIEGSDFQLNGQPIDGLGEVGNTVELDLPSSFYLQGVLSDGTPFLFTDADEDVISRDFTLRRTDLPAPIPAEFSVPGDSIAQGIRSGQSVRVQSGGSIEDNFRAGIGSSLHIDGGTIGRSLDLISATLNMTAGTIESGMDVYQGAVVDMTGGVILSPTIHADSTMNYRGGAISVLSSKPGSRVNVYGDLFRVDGEELPVGDEPVSITAAERLTGVSPNGERFSLVLDNVEFPEAEMFLHRADIDFAIDYSNDGILNVADLDLLVAAIVAGEGDRFDLVADGTLDLQDRDAWLRTAAELLGMPAPFLGGDTNLDGIVGPTDLNAVGVHWLSENTGLWTQGDFNADGRTDALDLNVLGVNWLKSTLDVAVVPEPDGVLLASVLLALLLAHRRTIA